MIYPVFFLLFFAALFDQSYALALMLLLIGAFKAFTS